MGKLYIIGNGFDKAHGLPTGYNDFREWLKARYPKTQRNFTKLLRNTREAYGKAKISDLWCSFEESLLRFDNQFFEDEAGDYYNEDLSDYENVALGELECVTNVFNQIRWLFSEWIESIEIKRKKPLLYSFSDDDLFVTFNYTRTLEELYNISEDALLHIHGIQGGDIIMGHNNNYYDAFNHTGVDPDGDVALMYGDAEDNYKIQELRHAVQSTQNSHYKPIKETLITRVDDWFSDKEKPTQIIVLGHSYGQIDKEYFFYLNEKYPGTPWSYNAFDDRTTERLSDLLVEQVARKNERIEAEQRERSKA